MKKISLLVGVVVISLFCFTSSVLAADGWASMNGGTTGGQGGPTVTVTDEPNLIKYASSTTSGPYIIQVSGTIDIGTGVLEISANKTLRGIGVNPTLVGNVDFKNRDRNMIVENLNITNPYVGNDYDGMSVTQDINNVLITKCTFYDCGDGCLDISNNSDYITVSWCKFYYTSSAPDPDHCFVSLVGSSDKQTDDANNLRVTYHHNWWTTLCKERMPRVRYGQVHVYNNYYSNLTAGGYCIGVGCGARIRVESNYFNAVPNPWKKYDQDANYPAGIIGWNSSNIFYNCSEPTWATNNYATVFTPPYSYTLDDANDVPGLVQYGAGADGNEGTPPHWFFTMYGDFDHSGFVDMNDFAQFAQYWPVSDCNQLSNADYNGDCKVNFYELALFAENWLQ